MTAILAALAPFAPDLLASLGGLLVSPIFDLIKKLFVKGGADTPERTMSSLATTNPAALTAYVEAMSKSKEMDIKWFNRDVVGVLSVWIADLRAAIRPLTVIVSLCFLFADGLDWINLATGARVTFEACVTSWMGDRFTVKDPT